MAETSNIAQMASKLSDELFALSAEELKAEVVVLPLLIEKCDIPRFLQGKLYADFTDNEQYEESLKKLLRKLRIK